jgi:hypothetical protein
VRRSLALVIDSSATSQTHDYSIDAILRGMGRFSAVDASTLVDWSILHPSQNEMRHARYIKAADLIDSWLSESGDYDERVEAALGPNPVENLKLGK